MNHLPSQRPPLSHSAVRPRDIRLRWVEFVLLFVMVPVAIALFLPPDWLLLLLLVSMGGGLYLLHRTEGFSWDELARGWTAIDWRLVLGFAAFTGVLSCLLVMALAPQAFLTSPYGMPWLLPMVLLVYPVMSVLPQEVIFRPLFFRRYAVLMRSNRAAMLANAAVFALAHLMFWNWVAAVLTFGGGLIFAWAYRIRGSFPLAVALHSVAGCILFVVGLGVFFYSGWVQRPF